MILPMGGLVTLRAEPLNIQPVLGRVAKVVA